MPSVAFNTSFVKACSDVLHLVINKVTVLRSTVLFLCPAHFYILDTAII